MELLKFKLTLVDFKMNLFSNILPNSGSYFCLCSVSIEFTAILTLLFVSLRMLVGMAGRRWVAFHKIPKPKSRFYPQLKFDNLLVSFEAKPGYDILVADFIIPRNIRPQTKIMIFVWEVISSYTFDVKKALNFSSFMRNIFLPHKPASCQDIGPQFPTDITELLKYGTNLIQAFGFFGGHYIIAVSLMSTIPSSEILCSRIMYHQLLRQFRQVFNLYSIFHRKNLWKKSFRLLIYAEIIEGPSKISLNCPISFRRIKTPVKGHLCKHHQCFDYENYMAMNAKRPCWRCPHCNQPVSCVDIRIDQHMGKVLAETGEDATHVILDSNGSWKVVEYRDTAEKLDSGMEADETFDSFGCEASRASTGLSAVVDLTMEAEDSQGAPGTSPRQIEPSDNLPYQDRDGGQCVPEDGKPFQDASRGVSFISSAQSRSCTLEAIRASQGQSGMIWRAEMASLSSAPRQFMDSFQFLQTHAYCDSQHPRYTMNPATLNVGGLPAQNPVNSRSLPSQQRGEGSLGTHLQAGGQTTQQPYHNLWLQQAMNQGQASLLFLVSPQRQFISRRRKALSTHPKNAVIFVRRRPRQLRGNWRGECESLGEVTPEGLGRSGGAGEATAEQSWRPTGRMRGSLTGSEYSSALSHYTVRPSR
ncbi:unnamed protein product [Spirodela intermedia]|uniref:SP-RING-type domain-containing protein n=1 Tax=Spirodela intermedia TaxID=51605 RepID=A0A7I8J946_SPIIN|nr:unnamed protein product [Spirodela intermedia]CAA6665953.1 unnamed protein product [Spirodela intermedia]